MAGSNWDSWTKGNCKAVMQGCDISYKGVGVGIYKSWLYIQDKSAWEEKQGFAHPVVAEVHDGRMQYKNIEIVAQFCEDPMPESVYFCAYYHDWDSKDKVKPIYFCYGIGTYGYRGSEWVGVADWQMEMCEEWIQFHDFIPDIIKKQIPYKKESGSED